jgi:hypothetical protein
VTCGLVRTVFTTAHPDFAQANCGRVGFVVPDATGREVEDDPVRVDPELPDSTSSGTTMAAAITHAMPTAMRIRLVVLRDENRAMLQPQLRYRASHC